MTDRITTDAHQIPWVGSTTRSLKPVPGVGTWEILDHDRCGGSRRLMALTPGEPAPLCPVCDAEVTWQLTHLAPSVASDHLTGGPLP